MGPARCHGRDRNLRPHLIGNKSAGKLGADITDLLILHQPLATAFERTIEAYRALERLYADARYARSASAISCPTISMPLLEVAEIVRR